MPESRIIRRIKDYPRWDVIVKILLYVPLITINVFNVLYILIHIKEPPQAFLWQYKTFLINFFVGFPTLLLLLVCAVLAFLIVIKRISLVGVQRFAFFTLLLFFMSQNITRFPFLNSFDYRPGAKHFVLKKGSSLMTILDKSVGTYPYFIKIYMRMSKILQTGNLIIPLKGPIHHDYFFSAFVQPTSVEQQKYRYELTEEELKRLESLPQQKFQAMYQLRYIDEYRIIHTDSEEKEYRFFLFEKTIFLIPSKAAERIGLYPHD